MQCIVLTYIFSISYFTVGQSRTRKVLRDQTGLGRPCSTKLQQWRPCKVMPCFQLIQSDWSDCVAMVRENLIDQIDLVRELIIGQISFVKNFIGKRSLFCQKIIYDYEGMLANRMVKVLVESKKAF